MGTHMRRKIGSLVAAALAVSCSVGNTQSLAGLKLSRATTTFNLPAQPLAESLRAVAGQTNSNILFDGKRVQGLTAKALKADLSIDQALEELLTGTGLTYRSADEKTVMIVPVETQPLSSQEPAGASPPALEGKKTSAISMLFRMRLAADERSPSPGDGTRSERSDKLSSTSSAAEQSVAKLEEVVVTAQKREERAIDVPIAITALSAETMERAGIQGLQDLSYAVPGMTTLELGPGSQGVIIRGIPGNRGPSATTGIYVDEMGISGMQASIVPSYVDAGTLDLNRVEVLKGPQGTLFGEGSMGGTVRYITNDPDLESYGARISTDLFGNDGAHDISGAVAGVLNLPLVENQLGLRIAAKYDNEAGWIDRLAAPGGPVIEKDFNDYENTQVRVKGLWVPTDDLAIRALAIVNRGDGGGLNIVNTGRREDSQFVYEFDPTAPLELSNDFEMFNLTGTYNFGWAQLLSSTSYADIVSLNSNLQRRPLVVAATLQPVGFQEIFNRDERLVTRIASQEVRLASIGSAPFTWVVGGNVKSSYVSRHVLEGFDFLRFNQPIVLGSGARDVNVFDSDSWTVFGDGSYAVTSRLKMGAGVRYFDDRLDSYNAGAVNVAATRLAAKFNATTWRAYASYALMDGMNLYGSVATGFRSGGFNPISAANAGAPSFFEPEEVTSYELGTKMRLANGRVGIEVALFRSDYTDVIVNSFFVSPTNAIISISQNAGEAKIEGIEAALELQVTDRLKLSLSGDVTDANYTKTVTLPPGQRAPVDAGDPLEYVPEYSVSVGTDYGFNWSAKTSGYFTAQYNMQGEATLTLRAAPFSSAFGPAFGIPQQSTPVLHFLNLGLGAKWSTWNLELYARNVLNEAGALRPGFGLTSQARPRTLGVRFDKSF